MIKSDPYYQAYMRILKAELVPAMGCTEPISIAYAAAKARAVLGQMPERVEILVSDNIIKNVKSVVVPNTGGMVGIAAATAVGIVAGNQDKMLEVISDVTESEIKQTEEFLANVPITIKNSDSDIIFDIKIMLYAGEESSAVRITEYHTNIISVEKNGKIIGEAKPVSNKVKLDDSDQELRNKDKKMLDIQHIYDFADSCDLSEVRPILKRQVDYNRAISKEGMEQNYGANIGKTYLKYHGDTVSNRAKAKAAAGSDARMSGCDLPVIINSGSGNQGITVSIPIYEYAQEFGVSEDKMYRALIISNLAAIRIKAGIGSLSAYCGVSSAACAAGAGISYLDGGTYQDVSSTLSNALAIISGVVCDGAKPSCAAKIATGVEAGITGYHMQKNGQSFKAGEGIVGNGIEATIDNIARLAHDGMRLTDKEIISIMLENS